MSQKLVEKMLIREEKESKRKDKNNEVCFVKTSVSIAIEFP